MIHAPKLHWQPAHRQLGYDNAIPIAIGNAQLRADSQECCVGFSRTRGSAVPVASIDIMALQYEHSFVARLAHPTSRANDERRTEVPDLCLREQPSCCLYIAMVFVPPCLFVVARTQARATSTALYDTCQLNRPESSKSIDYLTRTKATNEAPCHYCLRPQIPAGGM